MIKQLIYLIALITAINFLNRALIAL